jgi:hypothetical protein
MRLLGELGETFLVVVCPNRLEAVGAKIHNCHFPDGASSRIVWATSSAHMAVAPAPETTNTVTTGPTWVTVPRGTLISASEQCLLEWS